MGFFNPLKEVDLFESRKRGSGSIFDVIEYIGNLNSDPETDGKKDGYKRAAAEYKPVYQKLKKEYKQAISEIQRQKQCYDSESNAKIAYLSKLEKQRDALQEKLETRIRAVVDEEGLSVSDLGSSLGRSGFIKDPYSEITWSILERKWRRKKAEKEGYLEAKQLYEEKLDVLRRKLEEEKANASRQMKKYADLISDILREIEETQMKIADLKIALGEE